MSSTSGSQYDEVVKPYLAPYQIKHGRREHYIRAQLENEHRQLIFCQQSFRDHFCPRIDEPLETLDMTPYSGYGPCGTAASFWNKSVPIYLIDDSSQGTQPQWLLAISLHNYLYRKWFRPYRSEIECGQFIARVVTTKGLVETSSVMDLAVALHTAICARLDAIWNAVDDAARHMGQPDFEDKLTPLGALSAGLLHDGERVLRRRRHFTTRPLFRAMAIVICGRDCTTVDAISNELAKLPVLVILTGQEEGLSAPITFESIADEAIIFGPNRARMSVETAVNFVMALEAREEAAFGPQPDPAASTANDPEDGYSFYTHYFEDTASRLGWESWEGEAPQLIGPSSRWVSTKRYPKWTGSGAYADGVGMRSWEQARFNSAKKLAAEACAKGSGGLTVEAVAHQ